MIKTSKNVGGRENAFVLSLPHQPAHIWPVVAMLENGLSSCAIDVRMGSQSNRCAWPQDTISETKASHSWDSDEIKKIQLSPCTEPLNFVERVARHRVAASRINPFATLSSQPVQHECVSFDDLI